MHRVILAVFVGTAVLLPPQLFAGNDQQGPEKVLELFPQQGLQHITQTPAWENASPKVIDNMTKNAPDLKSGNAEHHPGSESPTQ